MLNILTGLSWLKSNALMASIFSSVLLFSVGTSYLTGYSKGHSNGYNKSELEWQTANNNSFQHLIDRYEENAEKTHTHYLNLYNQNLELDKTIQDKIQHKEIIYKEIKSDPIIIEKTVDGDCPVLTPSYDSTLGVLGRAAETAGTFRNGSEGAFEAAPSLSSSEMPREPISSHE